MGTLFIKTYKTAKKPAWNHYSLITTILQRLLELLSATDCPHKNNQSERKKLAALKEFD